MTDATANPEVDTEAIADFARRAKEIERELRKVIVGQQEAVRQVLLALFAGGHVLLEGVPGLGKTLLVRTIGDVLTLRFNRIQFTPDLMPADIVGTTIVSEDLDGRRALRFQAGPVFANIVLADEINRATPKTQSALLEAMQEQTVSTGEATRPLPRPFFVLATQNPLEMEGTYPLPEAQLDRFFFKVQVPFPRHTELEEILQRTIRPGAPEARPRQVADAEDVLRMLRVAREVVLAPHLATYAVRLILATHPNEAAAPPAIRQYVRHGASPRGLQALVAGAQVRALLEDRFNVAREDLQAVALPALRHRLILGFEAQADGITPDRLIGDVLSTVQAPRP
ncbi:MAG TPA: MoxR family ATPase [Caulobacteraceae bacterium]|nr:MoxR family ATPase [Caulobacteraceae bacterium]